MKIGASLNKSLKSVKSACSEIDDLMSDKLASLTFSTDDRFYFGVGFTHSVNLVNGALA